MTQACCPGGLNIPWDVATAAVYPRPVTRRGTMRPPTAARASGEGVGLDGAGLGAFSTPTAPGTVYLTVALSPDRPGLASCRMRSLRSCA
jgi:hypothetical protein